MTDIGAIAEPPRGRVVPTLYRLTEQTRQRVHAYAGIEHMSDARAAEKLLKMALDMVGIPCAATEAPADMYPLFKHVPK